MKANHIINKPASTEYPEWFAAEIQPVDFDDLILGLKTSFDLAITLLKPIHQDQLAYRYLPEKWTIKEIWQHLMDVERILAYRAMRYARKDKTVLSGFDEKSYVVVSMANERDWDEMLAEYMDLRKSTIHLFQSFNSDMLMYTGTAGRSELTVRAVGFLALGHEIHHLKIIKERYLTAYDANFY